MLGNDIIDLQKAALESNWQRKGYLNKLFTADERGLIFSAADPSQLVWLLWSMKESAYKIINRETGLRFYAPKSFSCSIISIAEKIAYGKVGFDGRIFYTKSEINKDCICSLALITQSFDQVSSIQTNNSTHYLHDFNSRSSTHQLSKNENGIPEILNLLTRQKLSASVSHHGRFLAISFAINLFSPRRRGALSF